MFIKMKTTIHEKIGGLVISDDTAPMPDYYFRRLFDILVRLPYFF